MLGLALAAACKGERASSPGAAASGASAAPRSHADAGTIGEMAMPTDGGAAWTHHDDAHALIDPDGAPWGVLSVSVARTDAALYVDTMAVFRLDTTGRAVEWSYYHPGLENGSVQRAWRPTTPPADLVPPASPGAARRVALTADAGSITARDAIGRARVHVKLGASPDPAWPREAKRIELVHRGRVVAVVCLPTPGGTRVEVTPTSLP